MKKIFYLLTPLICFSSLVGCKTEPNKYTVTWKNWDGSLLEIDEDVVEGSMPEYNGETPTKEIEDDFYFCSFSDWNKPLEEVHSDQTYIATFKKELYPDITCVNIKVGEGDNFEIKVQRDSDTLIIDWGDGIREKMDDKWVFNLNHQYGESREYSILIKNAETIYCNSNNLIVSVDLGDVMTEIEPYAFNKCESLESISLPESISNIEYGAFFGCSSLENIEIPDEIVSVGEGAFKQCNKSIYHYDDMNYLSYVGNKFNPYLVLADIVNNRGEILQISSGCKIIPDRVLSSSVFENVIIPGSVKTIGEESFKNCKKLESVKMLDGIETINDRAFYSCSILSLVDLSCVNNIPNCSGHVFDNHATDFKILVKNGMVDQYKSSDGWSAYKDYITDQE